MNIFPSKSNNILLVFQSLAKCNEISRMNFDIFSSGIIRDHLSVMWHWSPTCTRHGSRINIILFVLFTVFIVVSNFYGYFIRTVYWKLILSQTANFGLFFQSYRVCRRHFRFHDEGKEFFGLVETTVGKGDIARDEQFLLFPQCFQKTCTANT